MVTKLIKFDQFRPRLDYFSDVIFHLFYNDFIS